MRRREIHVMYALMICSALYFIEAAKAFDFPNSEPDGESVFITRSHADQDYLYIVYEEKVKAYTYTYRYSHGCIKVFGHDYALVGTIDSKILQTDADAWREISAIMSNADYLYVGLFSGLIVQIDKDTLQAKSSCSVGDHFITGIVDTGDGFIYATSYHGSEPPYQPGSDQFFKINPDGMKIVGGFWAPDSTHALASDGNYLYSITCAGSEDWLEWGKYGGPNEGGMFLILDPVTMKGEDIVQDNFPELGKGMLVEGGNCYFTSACGALYKLDLATKNIMATTSGLSDSRKLYYCGEKIYTDTSGDTEAGSGDAGYYRIEPSDLSRIEHLDSDKEVFSTHVYNGTLYKSLGKKMVVEDPSKTPGLYAAASKDDYAAGENIYLGVKGISSEKITKIEWGLAPIPGWIGSWEEVPDVDKEQYFTNDKYRYSKILCIPPIPKAGSYKIYVRLHAEGLPSVKICAATFNVEPCAGPAIWLDALEYNDTCVLSGPKLLVAGAACPGGVKTFNVSWKGYAQDGTPVKNSIFGYAAAPGNAPPSVNMPAQKFYPPAWASPDKIVMEATMTYASGYGRTGKISKERVVYFNYKKWLADRSHDIHDGNFLLNLTGKIPFFP